MPVTVRSRATIPVAAKTLYGFLADFRHAEVFIDGLERLQPIGDQTEGVGAQFEAAIRVGPTSFETTLEIEELEDEHRITWTSVGEHPQTLSFTLADGQGATSVELAISYEEPGGIAAILVAPLVEQTVQRRAEAALASLRQYFSPPG